MQVGFKTDKGIYRSNNEDACFVLLPDGVFIVSDGVGGGNSGEIASRTCVNEMAKYIKDYPIPKNKEKDEIIAYLHNAITKTNTTIFNQALNFEENTGMATTLALIYINNGKAYIANVGDSRVYIHRGTQLCQLTEDHTYVNSLVKAGVLTREQAQNDKRKNMITRAVGADSIINPDYYQVEIDLDDIFIICTDGLYDEVNDLDIKKVIDKSETMSDLCQELIAKANLNGGHDNITVIAVRVTEEDLYEQ